MKNEEWAESRTRLKSISHFSFFIFHSSFSRRLRASAVGKYRRTAAGYTLLEVIISLALATLIVMLIGMAIDAHVTISQRGRAKVEQAQLARSVFRLIGDDLRSTILYAPLDFSSIANLNLDADVGGGSADPGGGDMGGDMGGGAGGGTNGDGSGVPGGNSGGATGGAGGGATGGQSGGGQSGGGQSNSGGSGGSPQSGGGASGGSSSGASSSTGSALDALTAVAEDSPGVYGSATYIELDISRLPRVDEYERMLQNGAGAIADVPSDVKTVAYYHTDESGGMASPGGPLSSDSEGGLVRRSVDRAVTKYASDSGNDASLDDSGAVLAPEVTEISFMYYDGSGWTDYWDMVEQGAPPLAVQITIVVAAPKIESIFERTIGAIGGGGSDEPETTTYTQVVYLPTAEGATGSSTSGGTGTGGDTSGDTSESSGTGAAP
jgi:hypothetical protein